MVPASVEVNDTTATWAEDSRNRRAFKSDRTSWKWDLHLSFHTEADLSEFERAWESGPLRVMIGSPGPAAALLTLSLGRYNHPPRGGSSNGTDVVYTVNCDLTQQ